MLDLEYLKNSKHFDHIFMKKWDIIFDTWALDDNLYIVVTWKVSVEKYTTIERKETKVLAVLKEWGVFWEASITSFLPKDVKTSALEDTSLLRIDWKQWIRTFITKDPVKWLELLKYIIALTNKRLLLANEQIIANYEMNKTILEIDKIDNQSIFRLIDKFKYIIWCDYILYFKSNPFLPNYTALFYDTRKEAMISSDPFELEWTDLKVDEIKIPLWKSNIVSKLNIWNRVLWFIVCWREKKEFLENDIKNINSIITWLSWIINQKSFLDEERLKWFIKWYD